MKRSHQPIHRGFSLIEVMIVTAQLAILVSLAVPGFRSFSQRAHRSEAISHLMQVASCQERVRAISGAYDTRACLPVDDQHYRYRYAAPAEAETLAFTVLAQPHASQETDRCGSIILDQNGDRAVGNADADTVRCWSRA